MCVFKSNYKDMIRPLGAAVTGKLSKQLLRVHALMYQPCAVLIRITVEPSIACHALTSVGFRLTPSAHLI